MLSNLKISTKLLLMILVPVVAMLYFAGRDVSTNLREMGNLRETGVLASLATIEGAVIHELQKERGMSVGFVSSKGEKFKGDLTGQRAKADAAMKKQADFLAANNGHLSAVGKQVEASVAAAQGLAQIRSDVDGLKIEVPQTIAAYTKLISADMDVISAVAYTSKNAEITAEGSSYLAFVNAKEQVGRERATLNGAFTSDSMNQEVFVRYIKIAAARDQSLDRFTKFAKPPLVKIYQEKMAGPFLEKVAAMRTIAIEKGVQGGFGVQPEEWFKAITEQINAMKEVEDQLSSHLITTAGELETLARTKLTISIALALVVCVISLLLGFLVKRSICGTLSTMLKVMNDLAEGNGDLTVRLDVPGRDELGSVSRAFNAFVGKIHDVVAKVTKDSTQVTLSSSQFQTTADALSQDARAMASQTDSVATASEEMAATSTDIARNCSMASNSAREASCRAETGSQVVQRTLKVMEQIAELVKHTAVTVESLGSRSDQIGAIVGTIEDIADQTNLLALNAAIEAARAGEMGRGFAVVADEVRALAERTTRATREIGEMIRVIQQETGSAVQSMAVGVTEVERGSQEATRSGEALQSILEEINQLTMEVDQIATAAEEQTATTNEISSSIHQVSDVVNKTAAGTRETISASNRLLLMSDQMAATLATFKINEDLPLILDRAKAAHISFVGKIRSHIDRDAKLDPEALPTHLTCRFGKWYNSEGTAVSQRYPQLRQVEAPHQQVHALGKEVIRAADAGERKKAWALYNQMKDESHKLIAILDGITG